MSSCLKAGVLRRISMNLKEYGSNGITTFNVDLYKQTLS